MIAISLVLVMATVSGVDSYDDSSVDNDDRDLC